jgi:hypothetical protein
MQLGLESTHLRRVVGGGAPQTSTPPITVTGWCRNLSAISNFVAFGEDFFNAEAAKVGAESRRESFSSATLGGATLRPLR